MPLQILSQKEQVTDLFIFSAEDSLCVDLSDVWDDTLVRFIIRSSSSSRNRPSNRPVSKFDRLLLKTGPLCIPASVLFCTLELCPFPLVLLSTVDGVPALVALSEPLRWRLATVSSSDVAFDPLASVLSSAPSLQWFYTKTWFRTCWKVFALWNRYFVFLCCLGSYCSNTGPCQETWSLWIGSCLVISRPVDTRLLPLIFLSNLIGPSLNWISLWGKTAGFR